MPWPTRANVEIEEVFVMLNNACPPKVGGELHLSYRTHEAIEANPNQAEKLIRDMLRNEKFPYPVRIKNVIIVVERLPDDLELSSFDLRPNI